MAMETSAVVSPAVNRTSIDTMSSVAQSRKRIDQHRHHHPQQEEEQEQQNKRPRTSSSSSSYVLPYNAQFVSIDVRGLLQQARSPAHHAAQLPSPLKPSSACTTGLQQQQARPPAHHTAQQPSPLKPSSACTTGLQQQQQQARSPAHQPSLLKPSSSTGSTPHASPLPPPLLSAASTATKTSSSSSSSSSGVLSQQPPQRLDHDDWPSSSERDWNRFLWALDDKRALRRMLLEQVPYQPAYQQDIIPDYVYTDDVLWDLSLSEVALL